MEDQIYLPLLDKDNKDIEAHIEQSITNKIRKGFIWKVYSILLYQITLTALMVFISMNVQSIKNFILTDYIIYICVIITTLLCVLLPICAPDIYRKVPLNYVLLTVFTFGIGYLVSIAIINTKNTSNVIVSFVLTFITVSTLTIYAWKSDKDFTLYGGILVVFLILLVFGSLIMLFFPVTLVSIIITICSLLLFAGYVLYDTQLIIGNKSNKFTEEDYILAAMNLYLDIINIFLEILKLLELIRGNN